MSPRFNWKPIAKRLKADCPECEGTGELSWTIDGARECLCVQRKASAGGVSIVEPAGGE
jgi:hypothetical protein